MNTYPELRRLMVSIPNPITKKKLGEIMGKTPGVTTQKLNSEVEFKLSEVFAITAYFKQFYPDITAEKIFTQEITNVTKEEKS
jgi:hypothetical protein